MAGKFFDLFILDEAHERSINTDFLIALLKANLERKNGHFKIVIMSATIETDRFMSFFSTDSLIKIKGRTFPIQIYHTLEPVEDYLLAAYNSVMQIHEGEPAGDILVFLTG